MGVWVDGFSLLALQGLPGPDLPPIEVPYLGTRALTGIVMLIHMIFATLFIGYAIGAPLLKAWGARKGDGRMERLAYSLAHFNVLTFSFGATWAVMFLVIIVGFYPRVTTALFVHFFWLFPTLAMVAMGLTIYLFYIHFYKGGTRNIWAGIGAAFFILVWQAILTGVDTFMVTGGGGGEVVQAGESIYGIGAAFESMLNPMFVQLDLHRTFGNLSWPAFAVAAWAGFMYIRSKKAEDRSYYDWVGSMGVLWGTLFLLFQPIVGFAIVYGMKVGLDYRPTELAAEGAAGPYNRLVGSGPGPDSFTSNLLHVNLIMIVLLFVLANVAMYLGADRHPEGGRRRSIKFFGFVAGITGLYAVSPFAEFPFLYMRYIMMGIMTLATLGALVAYIRGRRQFSYGSPGRRYPMVIMSLGVLAAVLTLSMGWMKSNSRAPYTIYGQPEYKVESERPVAPDILGTER
jgi:cytochrome d ubiquinol oxidase subunit I